MSTAYQTFAENKGGKAKKPAAPVTSASAPIKGREAEMGRNHGGGVSFLLDDWGVYDRFLLIGAEAGIYTAGNQKELIAKSFTTTIKCIKADGLNAVRRAVEISQEGRAPKNDPAVVAIALAAVYGNAETQAAAYEALPKVARTGTWLFQFVSILDSLGKWNAAAKRGVAKWYLNKTPDRLAVQLLKYQSRNGWSHRDVLRLAHVKPTAEINGLLKYAVKGTEGMVQGDVVPQLVIDFEHLKRATTAKEVLRLIEGNPNITWEMVPTEFHKDKDVMMALLPNMGLTAVIRKLGILTSHGVISNLSEGQKLVVSKLDDVAALKAQRVHPITLLAAFKQYQKGHGEKGSSTWQANQRVLDAIDRAMYATFKTQEVRDESYMFGLDVSGSMTWASPGVLGIPNLLPYEVAGVMALAVANSVSNYFIGGFSSNFVELKISPTMRLDQVLKVLAHQSFGSTNAALTFEYAKKNKMAVDKFVTITDNDINSGRQPTQALKDYRQASGKASRSIVIATSLSSFSIADPKDPYQLDIGGFDSAAPALIAAL